MGKYNMELFRITLVIFIISCLILLWFSVVTMNAPIPERHNRLFLVIEPETPAPGRDRVNPEQYYNAIQEHDDDSQNVHNSQVIRSLTKKFRRLLHFWHLDNKTSDMDAKIPEFYVEIEAYVRNSDLPYHKQKNIIDVIERTKQGAMTSSIPAEVINGREIQARENIILFLVWSRIKAPANQANQTDMQNMLMQQLDDCVNNTSMLAEIVLAPGSMHCINGRIGRILASLTLLDDDPVLAEPEKDTKEIRNIMYSRAAALMNEELNVRESRDPGFKNIYAGIDMQGPDSEHVNKLREDIFGFELETRHKIATTLYNEYRGQLPIKDLKDTINKAVVDL